MIRNIVTLNIPYWFGKKIQIDLYWRDKELRITVWFMHRLDVEGYKNDWFSRKWKHYTLYKRR